MVERTHINSHAGAAWGKSITQFQPPTLTGNCLRQLHLAVECNQAAKTRKPNHAERTRQPARMPEHLADACLWPWLDTPILMLDVIVKCIWHGSLHMTEMHMMIA